MRCDAPTLEHPWRGAQTCARAPHEALLFILAHLMYPPSRPVHRPTPEFEIWSFASLNRGSRAYGNLAMELIFLCRFFIHAHKQSLNSSILLRK
jgi:hypothetical protein